MLQRCRKLIGTLFVVTLLAHGAQAAELPAGVTRVSSIEGITEYRLPNGLKVLLFPDVSKPTITVNVTYLVGSRQENYGETGMAHLLEHMMFKGSPKNPSVVKEFNQRGMQMNGTTSLDRTNYYEFFQASNDNLKWALDMEADRMVHSFIARKDLDSEMTVVRNEFESGENSPGAVLHKRMQSVAFDWHNYGNPTIGNRSDIENVGIDNLQAFYRTWYQPDNAVLLVAGKFEVNGTLAQISKSFGVIPRPKRKLPVFWTVEPTQDGERSFTVRRKGDIQIVSLGYKMPSGLHPDSDALSFAADIMTDVPNGRLHKLLVETGKASQVFSQSIGGLAPGLQIIGAVVKKGDPIEPVRDALIEAVESFGQTPPTDEEMERVRRDNANQIEKMLNDHQRIGVGMSEAIALGDWRLLFQSRDQLAKVTSAEVAAAATRYFKRDNRTTGMFLPEDNPQRAEIPVAPSPQALLKDYVAKTDSNAGEAFEPNQDNILKRTRLSNAEGIKLALLPKKTRGETVSVAINLHWGDEQTLFGQQTIASLTSSMLMRGTSKYSRAQLSDAFDKLKFSGSLFRFQTTRENLPAALKLVAHVLKEPSFPASEFEQLRSQSLVGIEAQRNEPQVLAAQVMSRHFNQYPKGDWRAFQSIDEQIAELKAATLDQVKAYHKKFYGISQAEISVVGDFDADATAGLITEEFANWRSAAPYTRLTQRNFDVTPLRKMIDTPEKENGYYSARLNLDLRDDDADYPALAVADYLFGGGAGLNSRLMERLRQKDGLSYGGGSSLNPGTIDRAGSFSISAIAAPQNLAKVDAAVRAELERVLKEGFSAEEIARAKSGLLQQRVQTRAQDGSLASGWNTYLYLDRTFAWSKQFEAHIAALTAAQVNAAFRKAIDPARLSVVLAGDQGKIKAAAKQ
ncbi:zinc protease [Actimicrobium sp. GrIS 1.19]|uniref:M16 family metallopeptidase n=1 Tax=Actimicrobium sp. GrIS 1.19 TaxID=3071708 RepID=UPI002DFEB995|nr:zinc protease [Actimicrobium sp. GrIS 1.19]